MVIQFTHCEPKHRFMAQFVMIIEVFVALYQPIQLLSNQFTQPMLHPSLIALVTETRCQSFTDAIVPVYLRN